MKHTHKVTILLIALFLLSQFFGLFIVKQYLGESDSGEIEWQQLPMNIERPDIEETYSFVPLFFAILLGTLLFLFFVRFKTFLLWKAMFFFAVLMTLTIAFNAFIPEKIAVTLALLLAIFKVVRPNILVHNLTELFIYGGLAAIFAPLMNLVSAFMLLILISLYDMWAVWKTKHMIKLAEFQKQSKIFAGLYVPYVMPKQKPVKGKKIKVEVKSGILGGGDVGFPLIFASVVMKQFGFARALFIPLFATAALYLLFYYAEKNKYYPAMPFLSAGCFLGYLVMLLF